MSQTIDLQTVCAGVNLRVLRLAKSPTLFVSLHNDSHTCLTIMVGSAEEMARGLGTRQEFRIGCNVFLLQEGECQRLRAWLAEVTAVTVEVAA